MRTGITQVVPTGSPFVQVIVNGDTHTSEGGGGNDLLMRVYTDEQAWGGNYLVELDNSDETLNAKDYKGYPITLKMGYIGETASTFSPLWVWSQQTVSRDGKLLLVLNCVDIWAFIGAYTAGLANSSYNQEWQQSDVLSERYMANGTTLWSDGEPTLYATMVTNGDRTIHQILTDLCTAMDVTYTYEDYDGLTLKPPIYISNGKTGLRQLMDYTQSYLKWATDGILYAYKPSNHATVYTFNHLNTFYTEVDEAGVTIPNIVVFWSYDIDGNEWIHSDHASGHGKDSDSITRTGQDIYRHYLVSDIGGNNMQTESQLNTYADAALGKIQGERNQGFLVAPMHCSLELFDKIQVNDDRYTIDRVITGYVHGIVREYDRGVYRITVFLGGTTDGYTLPGEQESSGLIGGEAPEAPSLPSDVDWSVILPKAIQGYTTTVAFSATDWDTVAWSSGGVKFYDGTTQSIDAGNTGNLATDAIYVIYFDLADASPNVLKVQQIDLYKLFSFTEYTSVLCVVQRSGDASVDAKFLPGTEKQSLIVADWIHMEGLKDYTFEDGTVLHGIFTTDISAGHLKLTSYTTYESDDYNPTKKADDDFGNVSYTYKVRTTQINAGYLLLTSATYFDGEWYDESGILIDADHGIYLDGEAIWWYDGASYLGAIAAQSPNFFVYGVNNIWLATYDAESPYTGDVIFELATGVDACVYPYTSYDVWLGDSTHYWERVYSHIYYGKITSIAAFQDYDDIAMLRGIKHKDGKLDTSTFPSEILESAEDLQKSYQKAKGNIERQGEVLAQSKTKLEQEIQQDEEALEGQVTDTEEKKKLESNIKKKKKALATKDKAISRYNKNKGKQLQAIEEDGKVKAIDMMSWQSLNMGAILQLADKVEALEERLK